MKQILKSAVSLSLLFSGFQTLADDCNSGCNTSCNTAVNTFNTNCNTNFNNNCNFNNGSCDRSGDRSCNFSNDCGGSASNDCDSCFSGRTGLHYRSQGANTARELVGWQWEINRPCMCDNYGAAYLAFEYTSTFKSRCLAQKVFGSDCWRFEGSLVENRTPGALVADNFGLSRFFQGTICFRPRIQNYIVDFGLYLGLDCWCPGMYFRLHAPFVHTRWCLENRCNDCCEVQQTTTCPTFDPCYDSSSQSTNSNSFPYNFCQSVTNANAACTIEQALSGNFLWGDVKTPWSAGRFDFCRRTRNGLADIDLIFGYNFCNTDCAHFGAYVQAVLPTGRKRKNTYVFDPVVGNGGHFELGGGISAHAVLWSCEDSNLAVFFEGNVTHLFKSRQCRLFDFCKNGYLSRYLLLKEFDTNGTSLVYNGNLVSATNVNNRRVDVRLDVKGDASVKLAYRWCGFGFDLGYNIYGHSHEKIRFKCEDQGCLDNRKFGIKGTTGVCCFNYPVVVVSPVVPSATGTPAIFPAGSVALPGVTFSAPAGCPALPAVTTCTPQPDNCTQPNATAFTVVTPVNPTFGTTPDTAPCSVCLSSNSLTPAVAGTSLSDISGTTANKFFVTGVTGGSGTVTGTCSTTLVDSSDLNVRSAEAPGLLTHKVFAHLDYCWFDECGWNPHLGVGGEAEFEQRRRGTDCSRGSFNQWGVWVKGSLNF